MKDFLSASARMLPDAPALIFAGSAWTYAGLNAQTASICVRLERLGLQRGERVAVRAANRPELVTLVHALARMGAVIVPLNLRLTSPELAELLAQSGVGWLVADGAADVVSGLLPEERILDLEVLADGEDPTAANWLHGSVDLGADWGILFTSGTAGRPRGAVLTHGALYASATASAFRLGSRPDDRWLLAMPLYHVGGLSILFRCCLSGAAVVLEEGFSPGRVLRRFEEDGVTLVSLVPTMLRRLLDEDPAWKPPAWLRLVLLGGAAAPVELVEEALRRRVPLALTYGLTEAASQVATALPPAVALKPGSVGKPLLRLELRIVDENGRDVPAGEAGEIAVKGPALMRGYLGEPGRTDWLQTGDIGYLDEDGDLYVLQRRSDLIVSGGENVYPAEVEAALRTHPAVQDACVVGLPDPLWGQIVAAAVAGDPQLAIGEIEKFLRSRLAGYKLPRRIVIVEELPCTASGKICRPDVVALFSRAQAEAAPREGAEPWNGL